MDDGRFTVRIVKAVPDDVKPIRAAKIGIGTVQCHWRIANRRLRGRAFPAALPAEAAAGNSGGRRTGEGPFFERTNASPILSVVP